MLPLIGQILASGFHGKGHRLPTGTVWDCGPLRMTGGATVVPVVTFKLALLLTLPPGLLTTTV